jgi:hypothetical protein
MDKALKAVWIYLGQKTTPAAKRRRIEEVVDGLIKEFRDYSSRGLRSAYPRQKRQLIEMYFDFLGNFYEARANAVAQSKICQKFAEAWKIRSGEYLTCYGIVPVHRIAPLTGLPKYYFQRLIFVIMSLV